MENDFKKWLCSGFGWSNSIEYGRGGTEGFPDVIALVNDRLVPIECKTGIVKNGAWVINKHPVLPSQIVWHHSFAEAGGIAFLVIGVWDGSWSMKIVPGRRVIDWRKGYKGMMVVSEVEHILPAFERLVK